MAPPWRARGSIVANLFTLKTASFRGNPLIRAYADASQRMAHLLVHLWQ